MAQRRLAQRQTASRLGHISFLHQCVEDDEQVEVNGAESDSGRGHHTLLLIFKPCIYR